MHRQHRIVSSRDFGRVMRSARRVTVGTVAAFVLPGSAEAPARIGVTASKRVGNAVARNRAKRLLREAGRRVLEMVPAGTEVVLLATTSIAGARSPQVVADAELAVTRALKPTLNDE